MNYFDPAAVLAIDFLFTWNSELENINNPCHLKIYKITFDQAIIIISDVLNNPNCAINEETINVIGLVCRQFNLSRQKTMWIEQYTSNSFKDCKNYYQVLVLSRNICRSKINKETVENLLQIKL